LSRRRNRSRRSLREIRQEASLGGFAMKRKVFGKYIVADPKICHGQLTFVGTRIFVKDVLELVAMGLPWKSIIKECHGSITEEAIAEAVQLAGQVLTEFADEYNVERVSS
jgi:uncharacterized protein (DUF433 family)